MGRTVTSAPTSPPRRYRFEDLTLDTGQRRLWRGEEEVQLSKLSFDFLHALVEAAPNLRTHDQLAEAVWGPRRVVTPENLSQRLMMLRQALGEHAEQPRYIEAVRGQGYRLIADVETLGPQAQPERFRPTHDLPLRESAAQSTRQRFNYAIVGLLALAVTVLVIDRLLLTERAVTMPAPSAGAAGVTPARVMIALPEGAHLAVDTEHPVLALSPGGSRLVFVAETNGLRRLYLRELAGVEARPIPGSDGAAAPIFSPDGNRIGFVAGGFKRVAVDGGVPVVVLRAADIRNRRARSWSEQPKGAAGACAIRLKLAIRGRSTSLDRPAESARARATEPSPIGMTVAPPPWRSLRKAQQLQWRSPHLRTSQGREA